VPRRRFGSNFARNGHLNVVLYYSPQPSVKLADEVASWSLPSLQTRLVKISTWIVRHARTITSLAATTITGTDMMRDSPLH
jgi:hypothetical protein